MSHNISFDFLRRHFDGECFFPVGHTPTSVKRTKSYNRTHLIGRTTHKVSAALQQVAAAAIAAAAAAILRHTPS